MASSEQPDPVDPAASSAAGSGPADPDASLPTPKRRTIHLPHVFAAVGLLAIIALLIVVAVLVAGGDDDGDGGDGGGDAAAVQTALARDAAQLAGTGEPAALAAATCTAAGGANFDCTPKGAAEPVRIVRQPDGTLGKRLAGLTETTELRSSEGVAAALAADAQARDQGAPTYRCGTSLRLTPEGAPEPGTASGFLCVADTSAAGGGDTGVGKATGSRYVELNADGVATRDFVVSLK